MINIIDENKAKNDFIIYHWSNAEITIYGKIYERYYSLLDDYHSIDLKWYDLLKYFKNNNLVIKGAFNFSLKSIAKALHNLGYIKTKWEDDEISNGLNAMIKAVECSKKAKNINVPMSELTTMKKIIEYNEVDCKVLLEILSFIRHNLLNTSNPNE